MATSGKTWAVVGASRGLGHEFVRQILARDEQVIATVRDPGAQQTPELLHDRCEVFACDMLSEQSIDTFAAALIDASTSRVDYLLLNAGVLKYPNRATELCVFESSYNDFALHLHTNTIGPIICAQRLVKSGISIGTICFISSDSGSAQNFREMEDGFAAYAASKSALNQMLRHMAAELKRKGNDTLVIALHPGEVATDMAKVELGWDVEGQMTPAESVAKCIEVIESKGPTDSGTFWTWENEPYPW